MIAVAEGAGQHLFNECNGSCDASGNKHYQDIGIFLRDKICEYFKQENIPISLKYIDPSYLIRSVPANTADRLLSDQMARYAVHAAMAGNTDVTDRHVEQRLRPRADLHRHPREETDGAHRRTLDQRAPLHRPTPLALGPRPGQRQTKTTKPTPPKSPNTNSR